MGPQRTSVDFYDLGQRISKHKESRNSEFLILEELKIADIAFSCLYSAGQQTYWMFFSSFLNNSFYFAFNYFWPLLHRGFLQLQQACSLL